MYDDTISRQSAIDAIKRAIWDKQTAKDAIDAVCNIPSEQSELVRCKDCIYGFLYVDVQNGVTDSWIECRNPEGLNRDVSIDGYCSASIRRT